MRPEAETLAFLRQLAATPRAAGSAEEIRARKACAEYLGTCGFETCEEPFTYSSLPGRWGVPIVGIVWLTAGLAAVHGAVNPPGEPGRSIAFALVLSGWLISFVLSVTVTGGRFSRRESSNLIATRGTDPMIWLCAHLDTKSQGVPTLVRTGTLIAAGASAAGLVALHVTQMLMGAELGLPWLITGALLASAAVVMVACVVGNASPGAADNASGVAAVLSTAAATAPKPLGVVLTSAEELGLAGARAWAAAAVSGRGRRPRLIINCDTLDDEGATRCLVHDRRDRQLAAELGAAAAALGMPVKITRHTPGIMVDSAALAARGLPAVTLSRVSLGTLGRIHTRHDTADRLTGEGVATTAEAMTAFIRENA